MKNISIFNSANITHTLNMKFGLISNRLMNVDFAVEIKLSKVNIIMVNICFGINNWEGWGGGMALL